MNDRYEKKSFRRIPTESFGWTDQQRNTGSEEQKMKY